jgi:hypothetical protein
MKQKHKKIKFQSLGFGNMVERANILLSKAEKLLKDLSKLMQELNTLIEDFKIFEISVRLDNLGPESAETQKILTLMKDTSVALESLKKSNQVIFSDLGMD